MFSTDEAEKWNPDFVLSVKLGVDLTPDGRFEERLQAAVDAAKDCSTLLRQLEKAVDAYVQVVHSS